MKRKNISWKKIKGKIFFAFDLSPDMQLKFPADILSQNPTSLPPPPPATGSDRKNCWPINTM
jgi:hypothetical protein